MLTSIPAKIVVKNDDQCCHGKCPVWDDHKNRLIWLNDETQTIWQYFPRRERCPLNCQTLPELSENHGISSLCLSQRELANVLVCASEQAVLLLDLDSNSFTDFLEFGEDACSENASVNADHEGRLVIGGYDNSLHQIVENQALMPEMILPREVSGNHDVSWNHAGRTMYLTDSNMHQIRKYDYDVLGRPSQAEVFLDLATGERDCYPVATCVDSNEFVWCAEYGRGRVVQYDPCGRAVAQVDVPEPFVTGIAFGGPHMNTLYITTRYFSDDARTHGHVYAAEVSFLGWSVGQSTFRFVHSVPREQTAQTILLDRVFGMVLGAAIGDSIGSYLEFNPSMTDEDFVNAMQMPGGGFRFRTRLTEGQVTDDTEMALALGRGLSNICGLQRSGCVRHEFDSRQLGRAYDEWYRSNPFDIGNATYECVTHAPHVGHMRRASKEHNRKMDDLYRGGGNKANGSLMRISPLIVYGHKLVDSDLAQIVIADCSLTHANETVYCCNVTYAVAAKYCLNHPQDENRRNHAVERAMRWLETCGKRDYPGGALEVERWLTQACTVTSSAEFDELASSRKGFIVHAYQRAFFHLANGSSFFDAIQDTIRDEGDTDTNAAIVGGLVGAAIGWDEIPEMFRRKLLLCKPAKPQRDAKWQPRRFLQEKILLTLASQAPLKVECV